MQGVKRIFFKGTMNIAKKPLKQLVERNILIEKNDQIYV